MWFERVNLTLHTNTYKHQKNFLLLKYCKHFFFATSSVISAWIIFLIVKGSSTQCSKHCIIQRVIIVSKPKGSSVCVHASNSPVVGRCSEICIKVTLNFKILEYTNPWYELFSVGLSTLPKTSDNLNSWYQHQHQLEADV